MDLRNLFELTAWFNLNKARANSEELVKQGRHAEALRRGLKDRKDCPYCGAKLPKIGVEICMHCRKELAWVYSTPCKPGTEPQVKKKLDKERKARLRKLEERANQAEAERQLAEEQAAKFKERAPAWITGGTLFFLGAVVGFLLKAAEGDGDIGGKVSFGECVTSALTIATVVTSFYAFVLWLWSRR
tara:strand:- start:9461 stop:10021 length:561 start_codon:yes stop_codon:yes gene_type:complete